MADNLSSAVRERSADAARAASYPRDDGPTIASALARHARTRDEAPALVAFGSSNVSFSQLLACIDAFAEQLANAGLRREDRVGLLVPAGGYGAQLVVALASNITLVPINPALTVHELIEVSEVSGLQAVVRARTFRVVGLVPAGKQRIFRCRGRSPAGTWPLWSCPRRRISSG